MHHTQRGLPGRPCGPRFRRLRTIALALRRLRCKIQLRPHGEVMSRVRRRQRDRQVLLRRSVEDYRLDQKLPT